MIEQTESYKMILEEIFERDIILKKSVAKNNCISAVCRNEDSIFKINFIERLKRLRAYYLPDESTIRKLIEITINIGQSNGYKWSGPYSELVTLDYWTSFEDLRHVEFISKEDVNSFPESIAKRIGQSAVDIDLKIQLSFRTIYTDVKSFIPLQTALVDRILEKVQHKTLVKEFQIGVDEVYSVDYLRVSGDLKSEVKGSLVSQLVQAVNEHSTYLSYKLKSGEYIKFRIAYPKNGKGSLLITISENDPYQMAKDYTYKILDYYNKLVFDAPSLITWVVNPWFSKELFLNREDFRQAFLRSLARRIFMDISNDVTMMSEYFFDDFKSNDISVSAMSKLVTGIVFIFDNSISSKDDDRYKSYIFLNPNATNGVLKFSDLSILSWGPARYYTFIDDFQNDHY